MPFMRVTRGRFDPANADEVESIRPELVAALQRLPGLQHFHVGIDREGGRGVVVAIFDTREHAESPPEALGPVLARLQPAGVQPESREVYEIREDAQ